MWAGDLTTQISYVLKNFYTFNKCLSNAYSEPDSALQDENTTRWVRLLISLRLYSRGKDRYLNNYNPKELVKRGSMSTVGAHDKDT